MDPNQIIALVQSHAWIPLAALVIAFAVRLVKSDTTIPIDIPPRWRVWLALGLGAVSGVLESKVKGVAWQPAIAGGLVSAVMAILGHNLVIGSLRGGKEFAVPGLIKPGTPPGPGKPPSIPPAAGAANAGFITEGALRLLGVLGFATILVLAIGWCITAPGCQPAKPAAIPGDVVNLSADACQFIGDLVGLPDWVELLCQSASGQVVKIAMPRADYHAMLARSHALDAGPGK